MEASVQVHEQKTGELLHAVLESATNAAIVWDAETDSYLANHQALELHGLPPASMPFDQWGAFYEARWPSGVTTQLEELPLSRACRGETVPEQRLEIHPRIGQARTVDVRAVPLLDADRHLIGAMSVFRDVESLDAAGEAARLRSQVTANMAEGVTVIRASDGRVVYVNDVVEKTLGYEPGELVGRDAATLISPDQGSPGTLSAVIAKALRRDGEWHGEVENVRKDGTRIWCWANVSSFDHAEHGIVWVAVQTDVTERHSAEQKLRHAEERFRKVFEEGPVGILMFGDDLAISDANNAFSRITGYARDELVARNMVDLLEAADAAVAFEQARRLFSGDRASYRAEQRCLTKSGAAVWTSFTATVVRDDAGSPLYGLAIVEDISGRKRTEGLMVSQNERLSADLESSLDELQLSRARILASADLERRRIERDLHDGAQQRLVALRVRLGLAQDLLRDDPVRGAALLSDLGDDVDAAIEEVRLLAKGVYPSVLAHRGLLDALRTAARTSPLPVSVRSRAAQRYPVDIETAVYFTCVEALQNAAKHAGPSTSVRISLSAGTTLRFEVRDDGAGFVLNEERAGAGLANMRDRIEAVGGQLAIDSVPGEGTCVSGSVPLR